MRPQRIKKLAARALAEAELLAVVEQDAARTDGSERARKARAVLRARELVVTPFGSMLMNSLAQANYSLRLKSYVKLYSSTH